MSNAIINDLINDNKWLIDSIARKFSLVEYEDLYHVGVIGLMNAYKNFDKRSGVKFSSYARDWVYGEIYKYATRDNKNIKVSSDILKKYKEIEKVKDMLSQYNGRIPTDLEIANYMEVSTLYIWDIKCKVINTVSADSDNDEVIGIYDKVGVIPLEYDSNIMDLNKELETLGSPEKEIILMKYYEGMSQSEIAKVLNMSQAGVSRGEVKALQRMRTRLI